MVLGGKKHLEPLLLHLRRGLGLGRRRVGVLEPAAGLALLELDARALARADADARPARAAADGAARAARRSAIRVVDAAACGVGERRLVAEVPLAPLF